MRMVIDCDPGVDDALAVAMALAKPDHVTVEAITLVNGNTGLENIVINTAVTLKYCQRLDIPVYRGVSEPLLGYDKIPVPVWPGHGVTGLGVHDPDGDEHGQLKIHENKLAHEALVEMAAQNPGQLHLVCLGPLTNVARAIQTDDNFTANLGSLLIMGGDYGDIPKKMGAEFNFFKDAEAADLVLKEAPGKCPVTIVPFDACTVTGRNCSWEWFDESVIPNSDECRFRGFMRNLYIPYRQLVPVFSSCDAIAMAAFMEPSSIEDADEFHPQGFAVQLEYYENNPKPNEKCPGGQRGCIILGTRIENGEKSQGKIVKIVNRVNHEHFKSCVIETMEYFYSKL